MQIFFTGGLHPEGLKNLQLPILDPATHIRTSLHSGGLHSGGLENLRPPILDPVTQGLVCVQKSGVYTLGGYFSRATDSGNLSLPSLSGRLLGGYWEATLSGHRSRDRATHLPVA